MAEDLITEMNGRPAGDFTRGELKQILKQEGETIQLKVKRGQKSLDVSLKLRRLV